jgi:uncharacterized protein
MARLLLLVVAVAVLLWLARSALGGRRRGAPDGARAEPAELVRCAHCGLHLPRAEARGADGRYFCSEEHRRLGARDA